MCLYPTLTYNRKYTRTKKNGGNIPPVKDPRTQWVPRGCGKCIECKKQKSREWQARLQEHIKTHTNGIFVTLTFSNEAIAELNNETIIKTYTDENNKKHITKINIKDLKGYDKDNAIATIAVHRFRERWRKQYKTSIHHWLCTELGHRGTENIHLHGIIWTSEPANEIKKHWKYGYIWAGNTKNGKVENYVNSKTINYIIKYISKTDKQHKEYNSIILTSPGVGKNFPNTYNSKMNKYVKTNTKETYITSTGHEIGLPIYWRNKIYTEEEREKLWLEKLDKNIRWIRGEKIDISKGMKEYYKALEWHRQINKELGYGNNEKNWKRKVYETQRREIINNTRIQKGASGGVIADTD